VSVYVRGVRSIRLDDEEHAEAGPLLRWDFFSEVGVLAVDVMPVRIWVAYRMTASLNFVSVV
jgi:hypothetical protein